MARFVSLVEQWIDIGKDDPGRSGVARFVSLVEQWIDIGKDDPGRSGVARFVSLVEQWLTSVKMIVVGVGWLDLCHW